MEKLGIQLPSIIAQIINFVILAVLLNKFLYKPVLKILDERKSKIKLSLDQAEKSQAQTKELESEKAKLISEAKKQAQEIIAEAKKQGVVAKNELIEKAKHEIKQQQEKSLLEIESILKKERAKLEKDALILASTLTKKTLEKSLDDSSQAKIIDSALKTLSQHAK